MPRGVKISFKKQAIRFKELAEMKEVPEIPQHFKNRLWSATKVIREVRLTEETEHFVAVMGVHFGLSKDDVILHAINLLWREVVTTIDTERLKLCDDHVTALKLQKLQKRDLRMKARFAARQRAIEEWRRKNPEHKFRKIRNCEVWTYKHNRR